MVNKERTSNINSGGKKEGEKNKWKINFPSGERKGGEMGLRMKKKTQQKKKKRHPRIGRRTTEIIAIFLGTLWRF